MEIKSNQSFPTNNNQRRDSVASSSGSSTTISNLITEAESELDQINDAIIDWNVTKDNDGQIIEETIDLNNLELRDALSKDPMLEQQHSSPSENIDEQPAQEKILIMLKLLRERVKTEAAFFKKDTSLVGGQNIEHGSNLRTLAYCLYAKSDYERKQVLSETFGKSMDRLDSFLELVKNSLSYTESTSSQLAPGKNSKAMNLPLLKKIENMVEDMQELQAFQAAGGSITHKNEDMAQIPTEDWQ